MLKRVYVTMRAERVGVGASLFDDYVNVLETGELSAALLSPALDEDGTPEQPETMDMFCQGRLRLTDDTFSLTYEESELTGMEGTQTQLSFHRGQRGLVTMTRSGSVTTALVFEQNKRHICVYQTPIMPFEVCVHTLRVDNALAVDGQSVGGTLDLDYVIEIRGARAERCRMHLEVREG